jgi:DNA-binding CsgD family transcriptional regulator
MHSLTNTYRNYLEISKLNNAMPIDIDVSKIVRKLKNTVSITSRFAPVIFLSDYTSGEYIYVDELCFSVLGFSAKYFMEMGVESYLSKWHPEDFNIFNNKIFPYNISFLKNLPLEKYEDIVFSYNYRILNAQGDYLTMLQRFSFLPGNIIGKPSGMLGMIIDITHFKADDAVIHTIEEITREQTQKTTLLYKRNYFPNEKLHALSKREVEILKLMGEGLSSKQIAGKLTLSINTVNNHRKNMLRKTGSANSSDLLNGAIKHGLI